MTIRLDNTYNVTIDNLIAGVYPRASFDAVTLNGGQGVLKRGTLIGIDKEGKGKPFGASFNAESGAVAAFVLFADIDTGEEEINAQAYKSGCFAIGEITLDGEYTLSVSDVALCRSQAIEFDGLLEPLKEEN